MKEIYVQECYAFLRAVQFDNSNILKLRIEGDSVWVNLL